MPGMASRRANLVWHKLIDLGTDIESSTRGIKRLGITRGPADRFKANAFRIAYLSGLPWQLMRDFLLAGQLMTEAQRKTNTRGEWRYNELTPGQQRLARRYYDQLAMEHQKSNRKRNDVEKGLAISDAKGAFNRVVSRWNKPRQSGMEAIMASVIVSSWTAFEVLAEDLWVSAVNARPKLGLVLLDAEVKDSDSPKDIERKHGVMLELPLWKVVDPKFRVHERMGDLLRNYRRNWAARGDPLKTYRRTFSASHSEVEKIFGNQRLLWTEATRNAIVHNAGHADAQFLNSVRDHPILKEIKENDAIPIDGEITHDLCMGAIAACVSLLDFVNGWLKNNLK